MHVVQQRLKVAFAEILQEFMASAPIGRLMSGELGVEHYKAFLRETYFYTREDPQMQAWATAWFRGSGRGMVKPFLRHAMSEIGHDHLALADLEALGADVASVVREYPLPATSAFIAFPFWSTQFRNPVSYLGYLYFLEAMPVASGGLIIKGLGDIGVPASAMTFIRDHTTIDVAHVKLMDGYIDGLVRDERDFTDVLYAMSATATLYAGMLEAAFRSVDGSGVRHLEDHGEGEGHAPVVRAVA